MSVKRLNRVRKNLGYPHGQWQGVRDQAESGYKVLEAHLEEIEKKIESLKEKRN